MIIRNSLSTSLLPLPAVPYAILLPNACAHTLLWLHGYQERADDLLRQSVFAQAAERYHTAIVFPDVPDTYYLNQPWNHCYTEDFLIGEFLPRILDRHQLPNTRDSLSIAGISMGGFGSLLLGAHHPHLFGKIASVSGAFILDDLLIGNPEVVGSGSNIGHFTSLFGDIPSLADDASRNPLCAIKSNEKAQSLPPVFLACGTEDLLHQRNAKLCHAMRKLNLDVLWYEAPGSHSWDFFHRGVSHAFAWLYGARQS